MWFGFGFVFCVCIFLFCFESPQGLIPKRRNRESLRVQDKQKKYCWYVFVFED